MLGIELAAKVESAERQQLAAIRLGMNIEAKVDFILGYYQALQDAEIITADEAYQYKRDFCKKSFEADPHK